MPAISEDSSGVTLDILVTPRASRDRIGPVVGDRLKIAVTSPPVEGEANAAVIAALAKALGVRRSQVTLIAGSTGRRKRVRVEGLTRAAVESLIGGR
jgi:uncharacterized protein (TIGR00251 family)